MRSNRASTNQSGWAPALRVLHEFETLNSREGDENAGFLSVEHGFMPSAPPLTRLSSEFLAWDQLAAELPALHASLQLRRRVEQLPVLDASDAALPARELLRACALLGIVAHAYWYVDPRPPRELPSSIRVPWAEVRRRLERGPEALSYIDLIVYNWRLIDPDRPDPLVVENLDLLVPTIGNREERVFYLTQLEILARTRGLVRYTAAAQTAVLASDDAALEGALAGIVQCLTDVVRRSLLKLDPNPYSPTHVNPVVWAKTVAPLAVPFHAGVQGPSGTSSPLFNTLDLFLGRKDYHSFLGREIKQLRATYPRAWQSFLMALTQVSVAEYVERSSSFPVKSAWAEVLELYAGQNGFLGRHRMKVYGYLELAFKVGRSVTIGGFGGVFKDRTWDLVDNELSAAQAERPSLRQGMAHRARVMRVGSTGPEAEKRAGRVVLDVSQLALRYQPGDRCLVLPENDPQLVSRTLSALGARGDEPVSLTEEWRAVSAMRPELVGVMHLTVRDVLRFGSIRPVSARVAEALHARTQSRWLLQRIVDGNTERLELWELLVKLAAEGMDPIALFRAPDLPSSEGLCRLLPPLRPRVYSISSTSHDAEGRQSPRLELTVGQLRYGSDASELAGAEQYHGTASTFLMEAERYQREVPFTIERSDRFVLPSDDAVPIVMFAGGTGISPFRAFIEARSRRAGLAPDWLFLSLRSPAELLYTEELARAVERGSLVLCVAFTRSGAKLELTPDGALGLTSGPVRRIDDLMLEQADVLYRLLAPRSAAGAGAHAYICGRAGFADAVTSTLKRIYSRGVEPGREHLASQRLYQLAGEGRLLQEIHTDAEVGAELPQHHDLSEIAQHNDAEHGTWLVIDRAVYDMTEFMELHPGGRRIIQAHAGIDATHGFTRAHHQRADVDAMREQYRIGEVRSCHFDDHAVRVEGPSGPVTVNCALLHRSFVGALHMVVEMQNAFAADVSLQQETVGVEAPTERTAYKLARALETHLRFVRSYLRVLSGETLPGLWWLCQGLLFPEAPRDWMGRHLAQTSDVQLAHSGHVLVDTVWSELELWLEDPRAERIRELLLSLDAWLLAEMKQTLIGALRVFEHNGPFTRQLGAGQIKLACERAAQLVERYHERMADELSRALERPATLSERVTENDVSAAVLERLYTGTYWTLEENPSRKLVVLQRTPLALASLADLQHENEQLLSCLSSHHREYGLVVDTRAAPLRNDPEFEGAMARLRNVLTGHFKRTAVLLESKLGELQVTRLERDERRPTLATRSESAALKFAAGGS
jgi:sulfite reductase (NADPH) flavoprotein alpha-component